MIRLAVGAVAAAVDERFVDAAAAADGYDGRRIVVDRRH